MGDVAEVWNDIEPEVCQNLIESMPRRVEEVIKAMGGNTKYWNDHFLHFLYTLKKVIQ